MKKFRMVSACLALCAVMFAGAAQAAVVTINFCDATVPESLVPGVYNYNMAGTHGWVGDAPAGAGTIDFNFVDWEPIGFLVGTSPDVGYGPWYGGSWDPIKNTFGYAGNYSLNGIGMDVTNIPAAWGTVTMNPWWGSYGPIGDWKGNSYSNEGGSSISTGNIDNGGAFGAIRFTLSGDPLFDGTGTWAGTGTTWNAGTSWVTTPANKIPGVDTPTPGQATFNGSGIETAVTLGTTPVVSKLTFSNSNYSISGGSLDLQSSTGTVTVNGSTIQNILSDITGTTGAELLKDGPGTLVLSGTNSFAGTIVKAGTLGVASSSSLPDDKPLTVGAGGTLIFAPASSFAGAVIAGTVTTAGAVSAVPEPSTFALLFAGLVVGFGLWRKRK